MHCSVVNGSIKQVVWRQTHCVASKSWAAPSRNGDVYGCGSNRNGQLPCMAPAVETPSSDSVSEGSIAVKEGTTGGRAGSTGTSFASATAAADSVYEPALLSLPFVDQHQVSHWRCCNT